MAGVVPATLRAPAASKIAPGDFVNLRFSSISSDHSSKKSR